MAIASTSCSSEDSEAVRTEPATSVPATTSPATTATTIDVTGVLAKLPNCNDLPTPQDVAWEYRTLPDWVPDDLPESFELTDAETYEPSTDQGVGPTESTPSVRWSLAELDGDRVVATINVQRGGLDADGYAQPGFSEVSDERVLDSVRDRPGRIARWVNRGDSVGEQVAQWSEDGDDWLASSELGVDELAAALETLTVQGSELIDSTGRFQVLGRGQHDPTHAEFASRLTSLTITERTDNSEPDLTFTARINPRPPGFDGFLNTPLEPGSVRTQVDGRTTFRSSPEINDARTNLTTTLADGSLLSIAWFEEGGTYRELNDEAIERIDKSLRQVATSLRPREPSDDGLMAQMVNQFDVDDALLPMCVER